MSMLRVWAPRANSVEVDLAGARLDMHKRPGGWWEAISPELRPGVDYRLRLDGGDPLPDPRSPWQPAGPEGPSRIVDHAVFGWTDAHWQSRPLSSAIIYELHVGTFAPAGTFDGAIDRLDHLCDLGVTHVELMPVAQFAGRHGWGYDGVDLYAPHQAYGGPDGLKRLVDACHAKGLGVILDVVYNHLGPSGCYIARFGPYFTDRYATPWGEAINYDGCDSDEVRRFVIDNALMWLRDYHVDGLRLDSVHTILDTSAVHILEELADEVDDLSASLGRHLFLIAESDLNDPRIVRPAALGGYGMDAQWSDDFHHALHVALTGEAEGYYADYDDLPDLAKALGRAFVLDGGYSRYRGRRHGRPPVGLSGHRFVGYSQNHDQIGNRARGERLSHLVGVDKAKIAAALVLTSPFVPLLFQGEEWAAASPFQYFSSFEDAELARSVSEGRCREFGAFGWRPDEVPDPQDVQTFERSRLDWSELSRQPHADMLEFHRRLIALRRAYPELSDGHTDAVETRYDRQAEWFAMRRGRIGVLCNLSDVPQSVPTDAKGPPEVILASAPGVKVSGDAVWLPAESVAVCGPRPG